MTRTSDIRVFKAQLVKKINAAADWRSKKAHEYPDDPRNQLHAEALWRLASHLRDLPDADPRLQALTALPQGPFGWYGPAFEKLLQRKLFYHPGDMADPDAFLDRMMRAAREDAQAARHDVMT